MRRRPRTLDLPFSLWTAARLADRIVSVAWDNASTPADDEVEAVLRGAAGRLELLDLPTYSPWLNPIEMLWRHFHGEITHCELFDSIEALITATKAFFERYNHRPGGARSTSGAHLA